ncbi:MAG TPA: FkbM family methyltransferase [Halothiobacillus sp.]|nr:FkbM family methyltransferase [Halothiobacillus sp.]
MLMRALGHIDQGFYIDIGANDPVVDSVSLAFHQRGWRGIHVEPMANYAELLRQQRPHDLVIQAVVSTDTASIGFYEIPDEGISTADARIAQQHRERGFTVNEIQVASTTLSSIFEGCDAPEIHWLKIDVEGFESQVIASWMPSDYRPWVVVVESTLPLTQIPNHRRWQSSLLKLGYRLVYFDGLNRYYLSNNHPELKAHFATPPNVFDDFSLSGTANAPFHRHLTEQCANKLAEQVNNHALQYNAALSEINRLTQTIQAMAHPIDQPSVPEQPNA